LFRALKNVEDDIDQKDFFEDCLPLVAAFINELDRMGPISTEILQEIKKRSQEQGWNRFYFKISH
jgi:hypothetical protein